MKSCVRGGGYLSGVVVVVGGVVSDVVGGDVEVHERWLGSLLHIPLTGPQRSWSFPYLTRKINFYMLLL
jgi:hypothetical protein